MLVPHELDATWFIEFVLNPLLETKRYFTRSLQSCEIDCDGVERLLPLLTKVRSLRRLISWRQVPLQIVADALIDFSSSLDALDLHACGNFSPDNLDALPASFGNSARALKHLTLRHLGQNVDLLLFVKKFSNLTSIDFLASSRSSDLTLNLSELVDSNPLLMKIRLYNFSIVDDNLDAIGDLQCLEELHLSSVPIHNLSFLKNVCHSLKCLVMKSSYGDDSDFDASEFRHVANLAKLEVLHCDMQVVNDECVAYLSSLTSLRELDLSRSKITSKSLQYLQNMTRLEKLLLQSCEDLVQGKLSNSQLQDIFTSLKSLKELNLSYCDLRDVDLTGIDSLKGTLKTLNISGNERITDGGMRHLLSLNKLSELNIWECRVTGEGLRILFAENPNSFPSLRDLHVTTINQLITNDGFAHLAVNTNVQQNLFMLRCDLPQSSESSSTWSWIRCLRRLEHLFVEVNENDEVTNTLIRLLPNLMTIGGETITDTRRAQART